MEQKIEQANVQVKTESPSLEVKTKLENPALKPEIKQKTVKASSLNFSIIFFVFLIIMNLVNLYFLQKNQKALTLAKEKVQLEEILKKESVTQEDFDKLKTLNKYFLDEKSIIDFINEVNKGKQIFESFSLSFDSEEPKIENSKYLPIIIKITGEKNSFYSFLKRLNDSNYILQIDSIEASDKTGTENKVEAVILGKIFVSDNFNQ